MAEYVNKSGGSFVLPDGVEIKPGATGEIAKPDWSGVAEWIADGLLVAVAPKGKPPKVAEPADKG